MNIITGNWRIAQYKEEDPEDNAYYIERWNESDCYYMLWNICWSLKEAQEYVRTEIERGR